MSAAKTIVVNALPVALMVALIPFIANDVWLSGVYVAIIAISLFIKHERHDLTVFWFGFFVLMASEYFFISTGVETFIRNSLFGVMPLWLPILWGYGFIAIRRGVEALTIDS